MFFRKRTPAAPATDSLPFDVQACIEGCSVHFRPDTDDGKPRILIHWTGRNLSAWHHSEAETMARLRAEFPELTDGQVKRAYRAMAARVQFAKQSDVTPYPAHKAKWGEWRPAPRFL